MTICHTVSWALVFHLEGSMFGLSQGLGMGVGRCKNVLCCCFVERTCQLLWKDGLVLVMTYRNKVRITRHHYVVIEILLNQCLKTQHKQQNSPLKLAWKRQIYCVHEIYFYRWHWWKVIESCFVEAANWKKGQSLQKVSKGCCHCSAI